MTRLKRVFQRLLFPAWWVVLVSVPLAAAGLIFVFAPAKRGHWLTYPAYAFSAYALTIVCACIVKNAGHARQDVNAAIDRVLFVRRYLTEPEFQVRVSLYRSLAINLGYVVWNLFCGRLRLFLIAAHDCRGHSKEKDGHADDRTNDSCDSFHNAVSLPRWDSGAAQNVIDLFLVAKREQRSFGARCPSAALSDVRLCGHASGFDV